MTLLAADAPAPAAAPRTYEVRTFGCQMNVHDSERLSGSLEAAGYVRAEGVGDLPGFEMRPSCLIALSEGEEAQLRESVELLREDGFDAALLGPGEGPDDSLWQSGKVRAGLVNPGDAVCSPIELLRMLLKLSVRTL